ncbi:protein Wnt-2 isoform X1 [Contarinia nasturtii]|uniref:protein Wnt-2 isoform X1 n=1 Tax=Contarinia nasturtii TaxID=265458 RepID=UPI0012D429C0|nr:protein Wnt-2 isoform X1 [Contarinia nasturtii]XP_031641043.1 protein Wnt-2 isoform X1 [Contarinia nasturtii]XP_031641053.1 protein Wnt-2 isoform X1 [Contarinia nasturtii]XP_031641061.1 protein Wnt-2 isoform X1 [Contarinia nasturtii]
MKMRNNRLFLGVVLFAFRIRIVCSFASSIICSRVPGLTQAQRQLCSEAPDAFIALGDGHMLGAEECQYQFKGHRWNCTQVWKKDVFSHIVIVGSREAAFTYAISSAGAVHAITAACARGNISLCGCDSSIRLQLPYAKQLEQHQQTWKWGGCSADINFGMKFARKFFDAREIEGDARSLMNLHNNRAGRKLVKNLLRTDCKCHGVSGSCAMKTCWKSLPPFRVIGDVLMKRYHKAKSVEAVIDRHATRASGLHNENNLSLVIKRDRTTSLHGNRRKFETPKRLELVHLDPSPQYCERNLSTGSLGTVDRPCNLTAHGLNSCDLLCCGRGHNIHQFNRKWQCRCKFKWCCEVQCDICHERIEQYTCK